jgi:seryl-tRNA synthetase
VDDLKANYIKILQEVEQLRALKNQIKGKPTPEELETAQKNKKKLKQKEEELKNAKNLLEKTEKETRNTPASDVPIGQGEEENVVMKTVGEVPQFDFPVKDHLEIGESLDILDVKKAAIVSGSRFGYFKGLGAELEFGLMYYAFRKLIKKGFIGMIPPHMVKTDIEEKMGYIASGKLENAYYALPQDDLILISSSEHSVVPYHIGETMDINK